MSTGSPVHSLITKMLSARPASLRLDYTQLARPKPNREPVRRLLTCVSTGKFSASFGIRSVTDRVSTTSMWPLLGARCFAATVNARVAKICQM